MSGRVYLGRCGRVRLGAATKLLGALLLVHLSVAVLADQGRLRDLADLKRAAKQLDWAAHRRTDSSAVYVEKRERLVYSFMFENKSAHCQSHYKQLNKVMSEWRAKANQYLEDLKKPSGWLEGLMKTAAGPLKGLKQLAKFDPYLAQVVKRYESQSKSVILSGHDIECDLAKLHIRTLDNMLTVLQTDVKHLLLESPGLVNVAIFKQLSEDKFETNNNYYDTDKLTPAQHQILLKYYASLVDEDKTTVNMALEHYYDPGPLIIGRLFESCQSIQDFGAIWKVVELKKEDVCAKSKSSLPDISFAKDHSLVTYQNEIDFCDRLLAATLDSSFHFTGASDGPSTSKCGQGECVDRGQKRGVH